MSIHFCFGTALNVQILLEVASEMEFLEKISQFNNCLQNEHVQYLELSEKSLPFFPVNTNQILGDVYVAGNAPSNAVQHDILHPPWPVGPKIPKLNRSEHGNDYEELEGR